MEMVERKPVPAKIETERCTGNDNWTNGFVIHVNEQPDSIHNPGG